MTLLLVTIGAIKIAVLCDDKGKALDVHSYQKKRKSVKVRYLKFIDVYPGIILVIPGHLAPLPGCGLPWNVRDR
jgi:hypothetical protein